MAVLAEVGGLSSRTSATINLGVKAFSKSIGVNYIWHYPEDYDPNWISRLTPGLERAIERLSGYTGEAWPFAFVSEFQTSYPVGGGNPIRGAPNFYYELAVEEWAAKNSGFARDYELYDIPLFVFANSYGAYSVNYQTPIYISDSAFLAEAGGIETLLEHEIAHVFGLPDHMRPFANPEYEFCIMGNLYLGKIQFCSECEAQFIESNFRKNHFLVDEEGNEEGIMAVDLFEGTCLTATEVIPEPEFQNFVVTGYDGVPVGEPLMVTPGQTVTVHVSVDYRGPAIDGAIYVGIGWRVGEVIEQFVHTFTSRTDVRFEASNDFAPQEFDCDVDILTLPPAEELLYGTLLDMYAKIIEVPGADIYTPFYMGVIAWGKPIEEYELIQHTVSHFAYIYEGDAEVSTITLKASPFNPADWVPETFIAELEREARENGVRILETKVYVDTSPLLWTDFIIEVTGTPPPEGMGVGIPAIPLFVKIVLLALSIALLVYVVTWAVKQVVGAFKTKPGLDDMKPAWGKEALILDIQDAEWHWERDPTPAETLQAMSEEELRHLLNQIAEEEVPTGVGWAGIAVAGVVAAGVAVAGLALARPARE